MNAEHLLAQFNRIADAPESIPRLRSFIMDLAVRGKLARQDPNDEPASALLKRIGEAKRQSRGVHGNRGYKQVVPVVRDATPFPVAPGWMWASFGDIIISRDGERVPVSREERSQRAKLFDYYGASGVIDRIDGYLFDKPLLLIGEDGANLINRSTPIAFIARGNYWVNNHAHVIDGFSEDFLRYLELFINATDLRPYVTGTAQPKMNQSKMNSIPVALPPLAEQRRIVAKVDELMALCDRLETARKEREATRDRLAAATLTRLKMPDPDRVVFASHARFAVDNLDCLTTRPDQIAQLRQTILNLAVRGKLVHQDPNDEPVIGVSAGTELFPDCWSYACLIDLTREDTRNGYSGKPDDQPDGTPILRISAGTVRKDGIVAEEQHKLIQGISSKLRLQYALARGDLLACRFNGNKAFVGRLSIFTDYLGIQPIYPDKLIRVRLNPRLAVPEFIRLAGDSDIVRNDIEAHCATTVGNWGISASNLKDVRFPVPPLAEQRRIVAKVTELMTHCDRLESQIAAGEAGRRDLLEAVLHDTLAGFEAVAESTVRDFRKSGA